MKRVLIILAAALAMAGCGQRDPAYAEQEARMTPVNATNQPGRFIVSRAQIIADDLAYYDKRGVYIIKDTVTGKEYVGLSGVGIAELGSHRSGKATVRHEE